ncbi:hypothetical protein MMEU_1779 [Mycobacterium marinum str. Europe]|nr:hypothetical protein MMEU_1779 [Mycobacterium marinum str. Europe]
MLAAAGVALLVDFSLELDEVLDVLASLDPELLEDSLDDDPPLELFDFFVASRLSVR